MTFVLVSARGRKQGLKIPIEQEVFLIGSSPRSQIRSVKEGVGHQHCAIVVRKRKLYIQDLSSGHPTRVNGTTLAAGARQRLQVGDRVALGPMEFIVKFRKKKSLKPVPVPLPPPQPAPRPLAFATPATAPRPAPIRVLSSVRLAAALVALALICVGIGWLVFQRPADKEPSAEGTKSGDERQTANTKDAGQTPVAVPDKKEPERRSEPPPGKPVQQKQPEPAPKPQPKPEPPPMPKPDSKPPVKKGPPPPPPPPKPKPAEESKPRVSFDQHVQPIFQARCVLCHNAAKQRGGLDVTTVAALLKGGDNGPVLVPGSLDKSSLWESIDTDQMPKVGQKLTAAEKKVIRDWILTAKKSP